ncbi:LysR family transcriptional regulator [Brevundimonas nasdae]|uniref:LysR family transcriptional regulator n=1 Tax=Brevundimonas nasdae TaxID=172043 RepID=UPI003F68CC52
MDRFDAMRVFTRVVERRSFTHAADDLGLPRSSVTDAIKGLEARLGVRLLQRTTRQVAPTLDGEAYYRRCLRLISDLEDAEAGFTGVKASGLVRIDVHGTQARHFLLPGLPRLLEAYPDLRLHISEAHHTIDIVREGFDCILRAGDLTVDSSLIKRRLATLERGTFASPDYIRRFGQPETPQDLRAENLKAGGHRMVGLYAPDAPEVAPLDFMIKGKPSHVVLPSAITVTGPETNVASALLGLGLIQVPRYRVEAALASGELVEVLSDYPPTPLPVHVLYSHTRQLSPRLRVVIDWMVEQFRERNRTAH